MPLKKSNFIFEKGQLSAASCGQAESKYNSIT